MVKKKKVITTPDPRLRKKSTKAKVHDSETEKIIKEMLQEEVCDCMKPLQARVAKLVEAYEAAIQKVKADENQDEHDFLGRRLYNMTADIIESLLIIADASKAPELFKKSANVFVRMAEEEVIGSAAYIQNFNAEDLKSFVAEDEETAE